MAVLKQALAERGLLTPYVEQQLNSGLQYWLLERQLCAALLRGDTERVTAADVLACHCAKSFDYRALHGVLLALLGKDAAADDVRALLQFLVLDERLVDIGDDFTDYEDDVEVNSFNIQRCFVALHGSAGAPLKLIELIRELEKQHAAALQALPDAYRHHFWARHVEAAAQPGSEKWVFPERLLSIPAEEHAFRVQCASFTP
jgi:hypothetical protein